MFILIFRTYSNYTATINEWITILKLACEYDFVQVKQLAIQGLEEMDLSVVERLCIYQLYSVGPSHIVPLLSSLCLRNEGPTDEETDQLGIKTSLVIFRARESLRSHLPADVDHSVMAVSTICSLIGVDPSHFQKSGGSVIFHALCHRHSMLMPTLCFFFQPRRRGPMGLATRGSPDFPSRMGRLEVPPPNQRFAREAYVYCGHLYHGPEDQWRLTGNVTGSFPIIFKQLIFVPFFF